MPVSVRERIRQPAPGALRYGLLTVAEATGSLLDMPARGNGVAYELTSCATATPYPALCPADTAPDKVFDEGLPFGGNDSFAVYSAVNCGTFGHSFTEFEQIARERLTAGEQGAAELAIWTGLDAVGGNSLGIEAFNNSSPIAVTALGDADNIAAVVAGLENFAYLTEGYGYDAYIHAPVSVAAHAAANRVIVQDGPLKRTPYGSIWVFGGGYPRTDSGGTVPTNGTAIYITGKTTVWRDQVFVPPLDQTLDKTTNQQNVIAERNYVVAFDCFLGQITYTFPGLGA